MTVQFEPGRRYGRQWCLAIHCPEGGPDLAGIVAYGAYIPYHRLKRSEIAAVLGEGGGKGTRAVASYDEDPTSMAVEAGRVALRNASACSPERLLFATANPPYVDKTNANVIHAALGPLARAVRSFAGGAGVAEVADDLSAVSGNTGTAQPRVLLASVLDTAVPGQTIALVVLADGGTAIVLRTTDAISSYRRTSTVADAIARGDDTLRYAQFLTWRGF